MVKKIIIPIVAALVAVVVAVGAAVGIHYIQNGMWYNAYIEFNGSAKEEIQIINTKEELVYHLYERYEDDYDDSFFVFKYEENSFTNHFGFKFNCSGVCASHYCFKGERKRRAVWK